MTRTTTPTYEQREETYSQPTTEYRIKLPSITPFFVESADKAQDYADAGAEVNARKGWE